jgi:hypothetical protein
MFYVTTPYENISSKGRTFYSVEDIFAKRIHLQTTEELQKSKKAIYSLLEMQEPIVSLWSNYNSRYNQLKFMDERRRTFNQST